MAAKTVPARRPAKAQTNSGMSNLYYPSATMTPPASVDIMGRESRPSYFSVWGNGLGIVPRRGWDDRTTAYLQLAQRNPIQAMSSWSQSLPLRLLAVLADIDGMAGMARSNNLAFAFPPGEVRLLGVDPAKTEEAKKNGNNADIDQRACDILDNFWNHSLPREIGGLTGFLRSTASDAMVYGMNCVDCVPDKRIGYGLKSIYAFDPLSVRYRDTDQGRQLEQEQLGTIPVRLDTQRVFATAFDGSTENPYGRAIFCAFLSEGLENIRRQKNMSDIFHSIVYPRLFFAFPFNEVVQYAKENPDILIGKSTDGGDMTPAQYANMVMAGFKSTIQTMYADEQLFGMKGGEAKVLNVAEGLQGLTTPMEHARIRMAQALDHPATMLNITQGGTQAYSGTEFKAYAKKILSLRGWSFKIVVDISNLLFRLLGLPYLARMEGEEIQTSDKLQDAQADVIVLNYNRTLAKIGYITPEEASIRTTGSQPADEVKAKADADSSPDPTPPVTANQDDPKATDTKPDPKAKQK